MRAVPAAGSGRLTAEEIINAPQVRRRVFRFRTYVPPLPDGRRRWKLPEGEVVDPSYDYARQAFTGTLDGQPWQRPWGPDLTFHIASQIHGWCVPEQGQKLFDLAAKSAALGAVVEVGSAYGLSAAWLGWGARQHRPDARVFCIDTFAWRRAFPHKGSSLPHFKANMEYAGLRDTCTPIQSLSMDAARDWNGSIGLLHIDAGHTYAAVRADFEAWSRFCPPGAVIAFDDCIDHYDGIMRLQRELAATDRVKPLGRTESLMFWEVR